MQSFLLRSRRLVLPGTFVLMAGIAQAVPRPDAIDWAAPPETFVRTLYVGVLGREPDSVDTVRTWAANITSDPNSRLYAFNAFLQAPEYAASSWSRAPRTWGVFFWRPRGEVVRYVASSRPDEGWHTQRRSLTESQARALVGFYTLYASRR